MRVVHVDPGDGLPGPRTLPRYPPRTYDHVIGSEDGESDASDDSDDGTTSSTATGVAGGSKKEVC